MIQRICVVGTGLIGCSFALALRDAGFDGEIVGATRSESSLTAALKRGAIERGSTDAAAMVEGADLVMLTIPMGAVRATLYSIRDALGPVTIVTDGGSVKGCFIDDAREVLGDCRYVVPGHPIAGREQSGVAAADPTLYRNRRVLLTPLPESRPDAVETVRNLWRMTGAIVECLDAETHDRVMAATSHLPHVLAFGLVDLLATRQESEEIFRYSAGGFRDFTRIASGDPVMWRDICLTNPHHISAVLQQLIDNLIRLGTLIDARDAEQLHSVFARAKAARDYHVLGAEDANGNRRE